MKQFLQHFITLSRMPLTHGLILITASELGGVSSKIVGMSKLQIVEMFWPDKNSLF